nr:Chain A, Crystal structure of lpg0076 protein from Legionella pneumophila [Legionella pneumophila subsp. pneumophila str. Philadelphia 1]4GYT_B Chain B, Crystal structure of lpg0076 protein from Legionella pneumophila [Legionella pneumophila subsp. pneumophila str. Philadelphia 1]
GMSLDNDSLHLPKYDDFVQSISVLALTMSGSELHGIMCGYLCAGADSQGEAYIRALLNNKKDEQSRNALLSMFSVFSISQQQMNNFDFEFEMLLPDDDESLVTRAQAFSEWCEGFTQGLTIAGVGMEQFYEEESQDALQHLMEFAELDCESLEVGEEDERALMEVSEYTRMAVLRLHSDLVLHERELGDSGTTH